VSWCAGDACSRPSSWKHPRAHYQHLANDVALPKKGAIQDSSDPGQATEVFWRVTICSLILKYRCLPAKAAVHQAKARSSHAHDPVRLQSRVQTLPAIWIFLRVRWPKHNPQPPTRQTCKLVCSWLFIRTHVRPVLFAMYSTNDVLPEEVGPCKRTGNLCSHKALATDRKCSRTVGVRM
jgi:hypothetical protein